MVKTQWKILFVTFVISCTGFALLITSIGTAQWLKGTATSQTAAIQGHIVVNYGLFGGSISRQVIGAPTTFELKMTCVSSWNVCAQSCQPTKGARIREVLQLLYGLQVATNCDATDSTDIDFPDVTGVWARKSQFISAGLYYATIVLLFLALLFSFLSALFAVITVIMNPVFILFSVPGLYIWNALTSLCGMLTLIVWGVQHGSLANNLAVQDTLREAYKFDSTGLGSLGVSYFLVLAAVLMHGVLNCGLLFWRQRIINSEPPPVMIQMDHTEGVLQY